MNCNQVRTALAVLRPDSRDGDLPELASEMMHLGECADCQVHFESQQKSDRELSRAMREVSIPADLNSRLLANLSAALSPVAVVTPDGDQQSAIGGQLSAVRGPADVAVSPDKSDTVAPVVTTSEQPIVTRQPATRSWNRRRVASAVSAAMLLLALGGWWMFQAPRQARLPVVKLLVMCHSSAGTDSAPFQRSFQPELPVSEIRLPSQPQSLKPLSLQADGREIGALFRYEVPPIGRGSNLSVMLVVIDLKQVLVPDLASVSTSFQAANVDYPKPNMYATRVWRVGQQLYVCYVRSNKPEDLDSLKKRFQTS